MTQEEEERTSQEIGKEWNSLWFVHDNIRLNEPHKSKLSSFENRKWLPADKAILISEHERLMEELTEKRNRYYMYILDEWKDDRDKEKSKSILIEDVEKIINLHEEEIKELRNRNPYPKDIFVETPQMDKQKINKFCRDNGISIDGYNGSWGRQVWDNCINELEKIQQEQK